MDNIQKNVNIIQGILIKNECTALKVTTENDWVIISAPLEFGKMDYIASYWLSCSNNDDWYGVKNCKLEIRGFGPNYEDRDINSLAWMKNYFGLGNFKFTRVALE